MPMAVRLAWRPSGTYDKADGSGGSDGATMQVCPEAMGPGAGLGIERDILQPVKRAVPWRDGGHLTPGGGPGRRGVWRS